jgi:1-deoxy-D-xylulose-5-phosphate synthase
VERAARHRLVVTVEDNIRVGGVGAAIAQALRDADVRTPLRDFGIPPEFFDHAKRAVLLERIGLSGQRIAHEIVGLVAGLDRSEPKPGAAGTVDSTVGTTADNTADAPNGAPKVTAR